MPLHGVKCLFLSLCYSSISLSLFFLSAIETFLSLSFSFPVFFLLLLFSVFSHSSFLFVMFYFSNALCLSHFVYSFLFLLSLTLFMLPSLFLLLLHLPLPKYISRALIIFSGLDGLSSLLLS